MTKRILVNACLALVCAVGVAGASGASDTPKTKKASAKSKQIEYGNWTGCLRAEDGGRVIVLADASGPNAKAGRNWKTAFITKKKAKFEVVAPDLRLKDKVGKSVQLTGRRNDNTLRPHSIKVLSSSCG